jgi:hypothetical protein
METTTDLAKRYNQNLSSSHRHYLNARGLTDETIDKYLLGTAEVYGESKITIPIFDGHSYVIYFKCRKDPIYDNSDKPKYVYFDPQGNEEISASIYGIELLKDADVTQPLFLTEGELDALSLRQKGYLAISGTGGCGTFPDYWVDIIKKFNTVYICFDNDSPGQCEAVKVAKKLKNQTVKLITIPTIEGVKDISEMFMHDPNFDFDNLVKGAKIYDASSFEYADFEIVTGKTEFIPSQFFTNSSAYLTIRLNTQVKDVVEDGIYVISSDRKISEITSFTTKYNYSVTRKPDFDCRWSIVSLRAFLNNGQRPNDLLTTYTQILDTLNLYLDLGNETIYKVTALWIIGTYFYRQFKAYPYYNINGLMNSGKSKMLELCSLIAFNGELLMGSTPAFIIRSINDNCSSIFLDEAEKLKDTSNPDSQTLILMLNSGYKAGAKIGKMTVASNNKGWNQSRYDPYSPKMVAGINNISDTLVSRSINLTLIASENTEIKNREIQSDFKVFSDIRDGLYWSVLTDFQLVREVYATLYEESITGRNWEVWKPILTLACVLDEVRGDNEPIIYQEILDYAKAKIKVASQITEDSQTAIQLLLAIKIMMESDSKKEAFYPTENIKTYLINNHTDDFGWLKDANGGKYIGPTLRKTGVIEGGSRVMWHEGKSIRGYDLNLKIIKQRLLALGVQI